MAFGCQSSQHLGTHDHRIENQTDEQLTFMPIAMDPDYYSPYEVAYRFHGLLSFAASCHQVGKPSRDGWQPLAKNLLARRRANGVAKPFQHRGHILEELLFAQRLAQYHASLERSQNMNGKGIGFGSAHV